MSVSTSWGDNPPRFVQLLDIEAQHTNKTEAAKRIGISRTAVSLLLNNKYPSNSHARVEQRILAALDHIDCPVSGRIDSEQCQKNRELPFSATNPQRIALYRACKQCPLNSACKGANS